MNRQNNIIDTNMLITQKEPKNYTVSTLYALWEVG